MGNRIIATEFLEFDLRYTEQLEVSLDVTLESVEQRNSLMGDQVRAILITFNAEDENAGFQFRAKCRVIFELDITGRSAEAESFLDENYKAACDEFYTKSNQALKALGWNEFPFVQFSK